MPQICMGTCPAPELLKPCTCDADSIICSGQNNINLKQIFDKVSKSNEDKKFNEFMLANSAVTELEDHVNN